MVIIQPPSLALVQPAPVEACFRLASLHLHVRIHGSSDTRPAPGSSAKAQSAVVDARGDSGRLVGFTGWVAWQAQGLEERILAEINLTWQRTCTSKGWTFHCGGHGPMSR